MATIKIHDTISHGTFSYIPYSPELDDHSACGTPIVTTTDDWKDKKVVVFSVPGAFTPTCHINHLPPYVQRYQEFKDKGVDIIAVIAANDAFVMSGWTRFEKIGDKILGLSDVGAKWSATMGLSVDLSEAGLGIRTKRYALYIDNLQVKYIGVEPARGVTVSGADAVLDALDKIGK